MPSAMEGASETTARAAASPYCAPWKLMNERNTVGSVKALRLVRMSAKKNSVQQTMKANTAAAAIPGAASGTAIFQNAPQRVQPSTRAACSSERGIWLKYANIIQTVTGRVKTV